MGGMGRLVPDLPSIRAWFVSGLYSNALEQEDTDALDDYLAFTPWRSPTNYEDYQLAIEQEWVKRVPLFDYLVEELNPNLTEEERADLRSSRGQQEAQSDEG